MDNAAVSQILPVIPLFPSDGYQFFRVGYRKNIPHIARYDNWNPTDVMISGAAASWMTKAMHRICMPLFMRPVTDAASPSRMKRKARTIEGEAPVIRTKNPEHATVIEERMMTARLPRPVRDNNLLIIRYMIPKCIPDRARMCEAPLWRNVSIVALPRPLLSPVRSAFMSAAVSVSVYCMLSMRFLRHRAQYAAAPETGPEADAGAVSSQICLVNVI